MDNNYQPFPEMGPITVNCESDIEKANLILELKERGFDVETEEFSGKPEQK